MVRKREIPGHNGADHPQGLAQHHGNGIGTGGGDLVIDLVHGLAVPADAGSHRRDVDAGGIGDRLTHIQGFQQRQFGGVLFDQVGPAQQHSLALGGGKARPAAVFEGGPGCLDRAVDIFLVAGSDRCQDFAVERRDTVEGLSGGGRDEVAADEGLVAVRQALGL